MDDQSREWALDKLENDQPGSFLRSFLETCLRADNENWRIVEPAFRQIQEKYPIRRSA